jgi:hypothetical protein
MANLFINSFRCPHCDTKCSFSGQGKNNSVVLWCTGCDEGVYFLLKGYDIPETYGGTIALETDRIVDYYPRKVVTVDPSIPREIGEDFSEASRCVSVSASRATVTQCRRAIQNACVLGGASPKADLIDQIDELEAKRVISPGLKDIAHTIRMIGNWGAHPQKDPLKEVTSDDASAILEFTSEFLEEIFVRPSKLKALRTKKGMK